MMIVLDLIGYMNSAKICCCIYTKLGMNGFKECFYESFTKTIFNTMNLRLKE